MPHETVKHVEEHVPALAMLAAFFNAFGLSWPSKARTTPQQTTVGGVVLGWWEIVKLPRSQEKGHRPEAHTFLQFNMEPKRRRGGE